MYMLCLRVVTLSGLFCAAAGPVCAQQVTVQQPVVQVFSVDTVVSVPDRGSAYLGGVSSAAEGRGAYGLFPHGSSTGLRRSDTGVAAGVYIHDFEAMDDYLLSRPGAREHETWVNPNSRAAAAFDSLTERRVPRRSDRYSSDVASSPTRPDDATPTSGQTDIAGASAAFYLAHARDAESQGRGGVAILFYRMAARHGSSFADRKLQELSDE